MYRKKFLAIVSALFCFCFVLNSTAAFGIEQWRQGIYISEATMQNARYLQYLIDESKEVGINTFVIDYQYGGRDYEKNLHLVEQSGIKYVARIVVFPEGGTDEQVLSQDYWEKIYKLAEQAIKLGASEIQLDYIRYKSDRRASPENAQNIYRVIKWFKNKLQEEDIPLQIDVFGIASFGDSLHIGQSLRLFADSVDAICPMVYPSHYEPFYDGNMTPHTAVHSMLQSLYGQFDDGVPFKVYPYIEVYNYRHPLSFAERIEYILQELAAVEENGADGWYAWSPHNYYNSLFAALKKQPPGRWVGLKLVEVSI